MSTGRKILHEKRNEVNAQRWRMLKGGSGMRVIWDYLCPVNRV